ncbi:MAG TPA: DUF2163 domain-containing protein [Rhizomicrobium sp.]|jgi:uncharacterized phage protein (TIGR02218 family)
MRQASAQLIAFLAARTPCHMGDLFTVQLLDGTAWRWTAYDRSLVVGGQTWLCARDGAPLVSRNRFAVRNTVEVPELELRLAAQDALLSNLKRQIHNGLFDGARIELDRAFMPVPGDTSLGAVLLFNGRQSNAVIDAEGVTLTAKGDNVLMNQQAPRNLYQTTCLHTFCDAGCALSESAFALGGNAGAGSTAGNVTWGVIPTNPALYTLGKLTMLDGAAAGQICTVRLATNTGLSLTYPLYNAPSAGDAFTVVQGCDRNMTTCQNTYNNLQHFRGYPFVPQAEFGV